MICDHEGRLHGYDTLPEGLRVEGDLEITALRMLKLPKGTVVTGSLKVSFLYCNSLLPEGIEIGRDLIVVGNGPGTKSLDFRLPKHAKIGGSVKISGCRISRFTDGGRIARDLILDDTGMKHLPAGLHIGGSLRISGSVFEGFGGRTFVGGDLDLREAGPDDEAFLFRGLEQLDVHGRIRLPGRSWKAVLLPTFQFVKNRKPRNFLETLRPEAERISR